MLQSCDEDGWYTLPGPAKWWKKNYNYEKHGLDVDDRYAKAMQVAEEVYQGLKKKTLEDFEAYEFVEGEFKVKGKATYVAYI
jgi:hypothetical protein